MRDFRIIRDFELKWKDAQRQMASAQSGSSGSPAPTTGLEGALDEYLEQLGEDGAF